MSDYTSFNRDKQLVVKDPDSDNEIEVRIYNAIGEEEYVYITQEDAKELIKHLIDCITKQ